MLIRYLLLITVIWFVGCAGPGEPETSLFPSHPDFRPTPPQNAMPNSTLVVEQAKIEQAKFPAIDFHFHGRGLQTAEDYRKMIAIMDEIGVAMICNMDAGYGEDFDRIMELSEPFRDRFIQFARLNWEGINEPGWSERTAAELERCFRAGAQGLKISKRLGLTVQNPDGSYIQCDDPRLDPIWEMCAKHNKPVMHHVTDAVARFQPIGPENERYEAGIWRDTPEGNYYGTGHPTHEEICEHREKMLAKHPRTRFVLAHMGMLGFDLERVAALLDKYPHADVEVSAAIQEVGRQPYTARKFLLKYQDRVLFGTDGTPARQEDVDGFWRPHFRFFETYDEYFDHPAQLLSPLGAPLHGRWKIYGVSLPDEALRKIYYQNALKYLPAARPAMDRHVAARRGDAVQ
ncbi:MAG: amidohydrolase family protein [bacterium]|nr:amidohydrolase family protein [bacterium]